jgi:hypothetical protein
VRAVSKYSSRHCSATYIVYGYTRVPVRSMEV